MSSTRLTSLMTVGALILWRPRIGAGPGTAREGLRTRECRRPGNFPRSGSGHPVCDLRRARPHPGQRQRRGRRPFRHRRWYRVWQRVYAGLSFTSGSNTEDAALTATVPHPFIFEEFRTVTGTTPGLKHSEQALHLQAMWHIPVTTKFDVLVGGGPTFFWVKQDLVSGITVTEIGNPTTGVNLSGVTVERANESTVGTTWGRTARICSRNDSASAGSCDSRAGPLLSTPPATRWTSTSAGSKLALAGASGSDGPSTGNALPDGVGYVQEVVSLRRGRGAGGGRGLRFRGKEFEPCLTHQWRHRG